MPSMAYMMTMPQSASLSMAKMLKVNHFLIKSKLESIPYTGGQGQKSERGCQFFPPGGGGGLPPSLPAALVNF